MKLKFLTAASLIAFIISGSSFAHQGAKRIVKMRMDAMTAISKDMKSISAMLNGKADFDGKLVAKQAAEISHHATMFPDHFKEEIKDQFTEASPAIWENLDKFNELSADMSAYATLLAQKAKLAQDSKLLKGDFKKLAGTCKSCHQLFRIKK